MCVCGSTNLSQALLTGVEAVVVVAGDMIIMAMG